MNKKNCCPHHEIQRKKTFWVKVLALTHILYVVSHLIHTTFSLISLSQQKKWSQLFDAFLYHQHEHNEEFYCQNTGRSHENTSFIQKL